ncbi:MAG TPA: hypothetical protein VNK04_06675 [Gemmataceae bacterium]|nr:hypothetical protein [Gemmataceae bacterium]
MGSTRLPVQPWIGALCLVGLLGTGCGGGPKTYPVKGKVVYPDGTPLTGGIVEFEALASEVGQVNARGTIREDGTFEVSTLFPGTDKERDGAVAGEHRVLVIPPLLTDEAMAKGAKPAVDPRYRRYETSGLKVKVNPDVNEITLTVKKPGQ